MIDVTFQLLIYFIVTATFRQAEGQIPGSLPADLGQVQQKVTVEPMRVVLMPGLTDDRAVQYRIDGSQPTDSPAVLYDRLQARKEVTPDPTLVIAAHPRVRWEYVVEAFNQAVRAAYEKISFQVAR
jgi:biopolymer transport protein ExbD